MPCWIIVAPERLEADDLCAFTSQQHEIQDPHGITSRPVSTATAFNCRCCTPEACGLALDKTAAGSMEGCRESMPPMKANRLRLAVLWRDGKTNTWSCCAAHAPPTSHGRQRIWRVGDLNPQSPRKSTIEPTVSSPPGRFADLIVVPSARRTVRSSGQAERKDDQDGQRPRTWRLIGKARARPRDAGRARPAHPRRPCLHLPADQKSLGAHLHRCENPARRSTTIHP